MPPEHSLLLLLAEPFQLFFAFYTFLYQLHFFRFFSCFFVFLLPCISFKFGLCELVFQVLNILVVAEYLQQQYREHSKAQRNHPCTKQQTMYMPIRAHTYKYQKKHVRTTYMRRPGCFPGAWSSWHL